MFWINKNNKRNRRHGHFLVNDFIRRSWNTEEGVYINCDYNSFKRERTMESLLLREQRGFCCYCMRHLNVGNHTSIEHVLPHHCISNNGESKSSIINYYKFFNKNFQKITYVHLNGKKQKWHPGPKYPHFCAYENLVISCDGSLYIDDDKTNNLRASQIHFCCNNKRGNVKIVPLFFITNIKSLIVYKKDGTISLSKKVNSSLRQKDLSNAIDSLGLEHERLRIIRQVWFYIAKSPYTIENVINAIENETLRKNIIADCGIPFTIGKRINQNIYWSLLSEYYWFYNYFLIYNGFV